MSDTWLIPGGPALQENEDGAVWLVPGTVVVQEAEAAPPVGAIMNQFQGANLGADLFNGTLL